MSKIIRIGPVGLPAIFLFLLIAYAIAALILSRLKYEQEIKKNINSITTNTLLIVFFVWKLSPVITNFSTVSKNIIAILYLPGNFPGLVLAIFAGVLYVFVKLLKIKENRAILITGLAVSFSIIIVFSTLASFIYSSFVDKDVSSVARENPALVLNDIEGNTIDISQQTDKILVLNFWATWCPPCRAEIPELNNLIQSEMAERINFYAVNLTSTEQNPDNISNFLKKFNIVFPVLLDKSGVTAAFFNVNSVPTTIIINKKGIEVIRYESAVTEDILLRKIKSL